MRTLEKLTRKIQTYSNLCKTNKAFPVHWPYFMRQLEQQLIPTQARCCPVSKSDAQGFPSLQLQNQKTWARE